MKTYKAIVYQQGSDWILSDNGAIEPLPWHIKTKKQVREFLKSRLKDTCPGQKLRITWA